MQHKSIDVANPEIALSYRISMAVTESFVCAEGYEYPVCPRCGITLEREYQAYCDRCGQALDWKKYGR